jgi:3-hydroxymyristoyl/3-hydroxydecanoyl-(acyl carrier protein) dehydratase
MRFILIDHIDSLEPARRITGYKQIDLNEDYFADHFPGFPVVPGVLALESLAQIGGRLVEATVRAQSGRRVCQAKIKYVMIDVDVASQQLGPAQTAALHEWSDRVWRQLRGDAQ